MTGALRATARPTAAQASAPQRPAAAPGLAASQGDVLSLVLSSLEDDKAEDVVAIDLRGKSAIADHMVIATGRSARQVTAIAEKLAERFKERFRRAVRAEGRALGDWVLVDCGDVIVHVFRPEVRAFYQIEKMWMDPADLRARAAAEPRPAEAWAAKASPIDA